MFVNSDGGLTTAGYVLSIILCVLFFAAAILFASRQKKDEKSSLNSTRRLVFCAAAIALATVTSYIRLFKLPWGGSVTLCSMLFIVLIANWYGVKSGIMSGLVFGMIQFLQEPYVLNLFQVCCDYVFAFAALGVAGFFANKKNGLVIGYIAGAFARGVFHSLGGYLFWMDYMPDSFPKSLTAIYPIVYNYSYIASEAVITVILLCIPAVSKALERVKKAACQ